MKKLLSQYLGVLLLFGVSAALLFQFVPHWIGSDAMTTPPARAPGGSSHSVLGVFLLQVVVIGVVSKAMGALFGRVGQPRVAGEMFAGILLGPSLFGWLAPAMHGVVFPAGSLESLKALSQVGVIVFMFCVGAELDAKLLRQKANTALMVSHVSIFLPFLLGLALAAALYRSYAPSNVDFKTFALFMGIAMSITAFPVLASIIRERGMGGTALGSMAMACAAIDDVSAWFILAAIIAVARAEGLGSAGVTLVTTVAYCAVVLLFVKPLINRMRVSPDGNPGRLMFRITILVFVSALSTELIGVHALFGAFLAGVAVSGNDGIRRFTAQRIEPFAITVLLPLFFCYTGLRTQIGLLNDGESWAVCALVVGVATLGKLGGGALAARLSGLTWRDAVSLGALMNTRGLMELVVLNIGLDLGLISPRLFSIMVAMALLTTLMTAPILSLVQRLRPATPDLPPTSTTLTESPR